MASNRRSFLRNMAIMGTLPGVLAVPGFADVARQAASQAAGSTTSHEFDQQATGFWNSYANSFEVAVGHAKPQPSSGGETEMGIEGPGRTPFLFHYGRSGFRAASDLTGNELLPKGDVNLRLNLERFRPSKEDRSHFAHLKSAQLRIDVMQTKSILDWIELLAWSAVAGVFPDKSGKLPPLSGLGFDPKTWQKMQNLVLPGGEGLWALNLAVVKKESWFMGFLQKVGQEIGPFATVLGLPAMSVTAFSVFTALYAKVQSTPLWVFKQGSPLRVFATKQAYQAAGQGTAGIAFPPGNYVVVPQNQASIMTPRLSRFELSEGYLVPKGTKASQVADAAVETLPEVTYATLNVEVAPKKLGCSSQSKSST